MRIRTIIEWLTEKEYEFSFIGNDDYELTGFASLDAYEPGKITWVKKKENYEKLENCVEITTAVIQKGISVDIPNQIISANSKEVFFAILRNFWGKEERPSGVGTGTFISQEAEVNQSASIGCNCSIVGNVKIGANTIIENNVSIIHNVVIGEDCLIHSGAIIGSDGFGFGFGEDGLPVKIEHFGGVVIGKRVEVGANTCIDRGTIDNTIIHDDVKIDNLVHIAHNVEIGKGAIVIAGSIICGSVRLGEKSYVAPGGIVKNQLNIGDNAFVGLGAVVTESVDPSSVVVGVPAKKIRSVKRSDK